MQMVNKEKIGLHQCGQAFGNNMTKNIFNADEPGIHFRTMTDSMLTFQNDTRHGKKKSKERITCLMACSMAGEKKLLIVGKSKNPRCFKNVTLPVDYEANPKSWMTEAIW